MVNLQNYLAFKQLFLILILRIYILLLFTFLAFNGIMIGTYLNYNDYYHDYKLFNININQNITDFDNCDDLKSVKSRLIVRVFDDYHVTDVEALLVSDCD